MMLTPADTRIANSQPTPPMPATTVQFTTLLISERLAAEC